MPKKKLNSKHKKALIVLIVLALLVSPALAYKGYQFIRAQQLQGPDAPEAISLDELDDPYGMEDPMKEYETLSSDLYPSSLNLDMVFYTQAPHSNWDYPWQEACEEASILLVANEYLGMELDREDYNTELLRLVDWEMEVFGAYEHTTVEQTVQMIEDNYGLETLVHTNPTFADIQAAINRGHFIVAPFAGKYLYNPNFVNGGPLYHMLVIKGYDAEKMQVITNDVGTRNGEDYVYSWDVIDYALHNWHDDDMLLGEAQFIEVIAP